MPRTENTPQPRPLAQKQKLTPEQKQEIGARRAAGETGPALAAEFGVTVTAIYHIGTVYAPQNVASESFSWLPVQRLYAGGES